MRSTIWTSFVIAVVLGDGPALAAKPPVVLAPLTPWNLHYAENSCQLKRAFGDPKEPTVIALERTSPRSPVSLLVFGGSLHGKSGSTIAKASFLPWSENVFDGGMISETIGKPQVAIFWSGVNFVPGAKELAKAFGQGDAPPKERNLAYEAARVEREKESAAKISALEVAVPGYRPVLLQTGPLAKALSMMQECAKEQLIAWGIDPAIEEKIVRPAYFGSKIAKLLSDSDYPIDAEMRGEQVDIQARLNIDAEGAVTKCKSLTVYRAPSFGEVVCARLSRAKFTPAELADGTKVPSYDMTTIKFRMPN